MTNERSRSTQLPVASFLSCVKGRSAREKDFKIRCHSQKLVSDGSNRAWSGFFVGFGTKRAHGLAVFNQPNL